MRRPATIALLALCLLLGGARVHPGARAAGPDPALQQLFDDVLKEAREGMDRLVARYPGREDLESVRRQLERVQEWTRGGRRLSSWQLRWLSFGLIAAREIEPLDPPLARRLEALAYFLRRTHGDGR